MFKKLFSFLLAMMLLFNQPLIVLAQADFFRGYENLPAGGKGFIKYPSEAIPGSGDAYLLRGAGGTLWVTDSGIWLTQFELVPMIKKGERPEIQARKGVNIKISFPGANTQAKLVREQQMPGYVSILKGEHPDDWARKLPIWGLLRFDDLYPGVDLVIRSTEKGFDWHYEFQKGADVDSLHLLVQGAKSFMRDSSGAILQTSLGELRLPALGLEGPEGMVNSDGTGRLLFEGLIEIYPQLVQEEHLEETENEKLIYSTYLGGADTEDTYDIALDDLGNVFVVGSTASVDFPVTIGDILLNGMDGFVAKFNMSDPVPTLSYATFIGGNGSERAYGLAVENGLAYITGETTSSDFPGAGDAADIDAFVVALNETGDDLIYSRLIGGTETIGAADDQGFSIAVEDGKAYLTGITYSDNFPVTMGSGFSTNGDIFVVKLNSDGTTAYATLKGGKSLDAGYGIDVSNGIAWITGETSSDDFLVRVAESAVFVMSLTSIGLTDTLRVFDGTIATGINDPEERGSAIVLDSAGDIYVTGHSFSLDFPVTEGVYNGGYTDAFLLKLSKSSTLYASYLGGSSTDLGFGIDIDAIGGVVVTGYTASMDFPVTEDAYQAVYAGGGDVFITRYFLAGDDPGYRSYSSYLGGANNDTAASIAMDNQISAYILGDTNSVDFPVTGDAYDQAMNGSRDAFLSVMAVAPMPAVQIEKFTNGLDSDEAPGEYYLPDTPLTWTYQVTNNGEVPLINIAVTDSKGVVVDCGGITSLNPDQSMVCTATGFAEADQYGNLGTVTAEDSLLGTLVSDVDASHYFGAVPDTELVKLTNDQDVDLVGEVYVEADGIVTWSYVVTNTGNVQLTSVNVTDDKGVTVTCPKSILEPGESMTCTASGTATAGQYENTGSVVGVPPVGPNVSDFDLSHYFGSLAGISIVKKTNGTVYSEAPGLHILVDDPITWTYELQNTGNVELTNVTVVDDPGTPTDLGDDIELCTVLSLDPGANHTCILEGSAVIGQYHNTATVTGTPPVGSNITASDDSYYFGSAPDVAIEFKINGETADTSPGLFVLAGSQITLDYVVTNTGNVALTDLEVKNGTRTVCTISGLAAYGASQTCTENITALGGQQYALATVSGSAPYPLLDVDAEDPIFYFGATPSITVDKKTNGQDAPETPGVYILTGGNVQWSYLVKNTGNVTLTGVVVEDDNGTPGDTGDDRIAVGCNGITLAPNQEVTCTLSGTAQEGQYTNTAVAAGMPPAPLVEVSDNDTSHYFGTSLSVSLEKKTNGEDAAAAPGPLIAVGGAVSWTYKVTNNSNVAVNFSIVDNPAAAISCSKTSLAVGESITCTASGTAVAGQFVNTATVTVTPPVGLAAFDVQDTSHYFGVTTGVTLQKKTNGFDADEGTGPLIKVGETVTWTYEINNTGNVDLSSVSLLDDIEGPITCPSSTLTAGNMMTCTKTGTAAEGQYANIGSVTANPPTGFDPVSVTDPSHYFGSDAGVSITKLTNGVDIDHYPVPYILLGGDVGWTYLVDNIGNLAISDILVTDSDASLVITCETSVLVDGQLLPGVTMTCTASGTAIEGRYDNTAYVEGIPYGFETEKVQDSDASAYFGANPSITIEKSTNGVDADLPPGPYIPVGEPITLQYEVNNPETDYRFIDIQVTDDEGVTVNCPLTWLDPGDETMICTAEATADSGQQALSGHVSAKVVLVSNSQELGSVENSDPSHYFGYTPQGLALTKYTNGINVEGPPGPELIVGSSVTWTYEVTNESNAPVADLNVSDDLEEVVACEKNSLEGNETITCSASGEVVEGQYSNTAQASGVFIPTEEEISSLMASSYYYGVRGSKLFLPLLLR